MGPLSNAPRSPEGIPGALGQVKLKEIKILRPAKYVLFQLFSISISRRVLVSVAHSVVTVEE